MISDFSDLTIFYGAMNELLDEFGHGDVSFMVQATGWNHRPGGETLTFAIYVGFAVAFRLEGSTPAEALAKVRAELIARAGKRAGRCGP